MEPCGGRQATARAHRIGQEQPVFVYKLVVEGSIEERMLELQERKAAGCMACWATMPEGAVKFSEADLARPAGAAGRARNNPLGIPGDDALRWGGTGKRRPRRCSLQKIRSY